MDPVKQARWQALADKADRKEPCTEADIRELLSLCGMDVDKLKETVRGKENLQFTVQLNLLRIAMEATMQALPKLAEEVREYEARIKTLEARVATLEIAALIADKPKDPTPNAG